MPTFGFSAYLKLICLEERPRVTLIRSRLAPSDSGYDFHRSLRRHAQRLVANGERLEILVASAASIVQKPERESVILGLRSLEKWRSEHEGKVFEVEPVTLVSPHSEFKVTFAADFGIMLGESKTAVHVWNSKKPQLNPRLVYAALSHFPSLYANRSDRPDDLAVLCLRTGTLFRISQAEEFASIGPRLLSSIEDLFRQVKEEPKPPRIDGERRAPPPPPAV